MVNRTAIFNSSPLIILSKLNYLEESLQLFDNPIIPSEVIIEIQQKDDDVHCVINQLLKSGRLGKRNPKLSRLSNGLKQRLGKGESEAIALGIELNMDYVILDDKVARREAERLGLKVLGSLGIILKLEKENIITINNYEDLYLKLVELDFRVRKEIFEWIFGLKK